MPIIPDIFDEHSRPKKKNKATTAGPVPSSLPCQKTPTAASTRLDSSSFEAPSSPSQRLIDECKTAPAAGRSRLSTPWPPLTENMMTAITPSPSLFKEKKIDPVRRGAPSMRGAPA